MMEKRIFWLGSAGLLGAALPAILVGKAVMFALLILGLVAGMMATRGESLRASVKLMLDSWHVLLAVGFLLWALVGSALGIAPAFALHKWSELLILGALSGVMFVVLREMPGWAVERLLDVLTAGVGVVMVLALLDALWGNQTLATLLHGEDKAATPYRLNFLSSALAVMLPLVWCNLWMKAREGVSWARQWGMQLAALSLMMVVIAGGRAGWVGAGVGLGVFLLGMSRYHGWIVHRHHWRVGAAVLLLGLLGYMLAHGWDFAWERVTLVNESGRGPLSGRMDVWQRAWTHAWDAPLWGIGVQNFRNLPAGPGMDAHPHNWFLQLLLETGLVGLALFVTLVGLTVVRFAQFARVNPWGVAALASVIAFLVTGLANTSLFNLWWSSYLVMSLMLGWRVAWANTHRPVASKPTMVPRRALMAETFAKKPKK